LEIYPPREILVKLGKMSRAEREEHTLFGVFAGSEENEKKVEVIKVYIV